MKEDKQCRMKYNLKRQGGVYLAQFSNGRICKNSSDKVNIKSYRKKEESLDNKILAVRTERLDYVGKNTKSTLPGQMNNLYCCVLNKKSGKMKIYNTELFHCVPIIECMSQKPDDAELTSTHKPDDAELSYAEKRHNLTTTFGSKAKQRVLKSKLHYQVNSKDVMDKITAAVKEAVTDSSPYADLVKQTLVIPPQNRAATTEKEVYNLSDIVSENILPDLQTRGMEFQKATQDDLKTWDADSVCKFVFNYLQSNVPNVSEEKCLLLTYYDYMIQFSKLGYKDFRKRKPAPNMPNNVSESLVQKFVTQGQGPNGQIQKTMPIKMKDKLMSYAMVLALFIEEFNLNLRTFQSDFKTTLQKVDRIAQAIGCHICKKKILDENVRFAVLSIPLYEAKSGFTKKKQKS